LFGGFIASGGGGVLLVTAGRDGERAEQQGSKGMVAHVVVVRDVR
jgi:hypothetical protein